MTHLPPPGALEKNGMHTTAIAHLWHGQPPHIEAPYTPEELQRSLHHGSSATALDHLPRPLLQQCTGPGVASLCQLLTRLRSSEPSTLLNTAVLLPLKKKKPTWLLRNSRPILVEPYLRRVEATIVFHRWRAAQETCAEFPSEMLAYRAQQSGSQAVLVLRSLLAYWAVLADVGLVDWDESSAFCNVPRLRPCHSSEPFRAYRLQYLSSPPL